MTICCVQVGQCGIQVGQSVLSPLNNISFISGDQAYHSHPKQLLVDTEAKTIRQALSVDRRTYGLSERNCLADKRPFGRGNNWAYGYADESMLRQVTERFRQVLETMDTYTGMVMFHSMAGGTGSGFGSRIVEEVRMNMIPKGGICNVCVMPIDQGECVLQNINCTLTTAHLLQYSDCVLTISNERYLQSLKRVSKKVTLDQVNAQMAADLSMLFGSQESYRRGVVWDIAARLASFPGMNHINMAACPAGQDTYSLHNLTDNIPVPIGGYVKRCFGSVLLSCATNDNQLSGLEQKLATKLGPLVWKSPSTDTSLHHTIKLPIKKNPIDYSFFYNSTFPTVSHLDKWTDKTRKLKDAGAFMHWYERYIPDFDSKLEEAISDVELCSNLYKKILL